MNRFTNRFSQNANHFFVRCFLLSVIFFASVETLALSSSTGRNNQNTTISAPNLRDVCAIRSDGEVVCWQNYLGFAPSGVPLLKNVSNAIQISNECAVNKYGNVYCWKIGNVAAQQVSGVSNAVSVLEIGDSSYCAVLTNGNVMCWGFNVNGEMGDGTLGSDQKREPALVPNVNNVVSLSTATADGFSNNHLICGVRADGSAVCWGRNWDNRGQIIPILPTVITNASNVRQIEITENGICLLRSDAKIYCSRDPDDFNNFANYRLIGNLESVLGMRADVYTGLCAFINTKRDLKCFSIFDGAVESAASGYLPEVPGIISISQLIMNLTSVCIVNADNLMRCQYTGEYPSRDCDYSASGAACLDSSLGGNLGDWYSDPNFFVRSASQPIMFSAPSNISLDSRTANSLTVSFNGDAASSDFTVFYREARTPSAIDAPVWSSYVYAHTNTPGSRTSVKIPYLVPNKKYEIKVVGRNWASQTRQSAIFSATTLSR